MAHPKFKLFRVPDDKINSYELKEFINDGTVYPHSISVDKYYQGTKFILIGYEEEQDPRNNGIRDLVYELDELVINEISFIGLANIGEAIEKCIQTMYSSEQIICQDIEYNGDKVLVTLLVAK